MKDLTYSTEILVRFNEADPLGIVWHGHYIRYFEDGREAFGRHFGISYMDFFKHDVIVPIVHAECNYKKTVKFGDTIRIESTYHPTEAAKIVFNFKIYKLKDNALVATGTTTQVFLDKDSQTLLLNNPDFFVDWKNKNCL